MINQKDAAFYIGSAAVVCSLVVAISAFVGDLVFKSPSEVGNLMCVVCAAISVTSVIMNIIFVAAFPPTNQEDQEEIKVLVDELYAIRDEMELHFKAAAYDKMQEKFEDAQEIQEDAQTS